MEWPEVTANTPISEVMKIHRRIWDMIIANLESDFHNWRNGQLTRWDFFVMKPETPYANDCVWCEYTSLFAAECHFPCSKCPMQYPDDWSSKIGCMNGLYFRIKRLFADGDLKTIELAKEIRDREPYIKED